MVHTVGQFEFLLVGGDLVTLKYFQHQRAYYIVLYVADQSAGNSNGVKFMRTKVCEKSA